MNANTRYLCTAAGVLGVLLANAVHIGQAAPVNDMFVNRTVITGTNIVVTGASNVGATRETGEPYHAGYGGGASVWWTWTAPSGGTVIISTAGSTFDTLLGIYVGSSVAALTEVASSDDDGSLRTSKVQLDVVQGGTYQIAVDGYGAASGSISLSVQLGPLLPPPAAPAWQLPAPNGVLVRSTDFAGKVVMYNFWGTTCGPCLSEMPDMVELQEKYRADGFVIIGADVSWWYDTPQEVLSFLASFTPTINYQIVMSTAANENAWGGVSAVPTTFVIDRGNIIRKKYVGSQVGSTFVKQIIPLLYNNVRLASEQSGGEMILRWPATAATFSLQSSTALVSPDWQNWPTPPTVENGSNTVRVVSSGSPRYFRLRLPY
jgi:thiol-disulfide isomerase/thioredoxin